MNGCERCSSEILNYLDGLLTGKALDDFFAHLANCAECMRRLEEEAMLSSILRRSKPLFEVPAALRARINELVAEASARAQGSEQGGAASAPRRFQLRRGALLAARSLRVMMAAAAVILVLTAVPNAVEHLGAANFVAVAAEIHRNYLNGAVLLQCHSRSPEMVTSWFTGKTPFQFRLPAAQSAEHARSRYSLIGASLVSYKRSPAALVVYETPTEKISLLVTSSQSAVVARGETVQSGTLTFHFRRNEDLEVITWTNHGLAYALVSSPLGPVGHSCLVCHDNLAGQIVLEPQR